MKHLAYAFAVLSFQCCASQTVVADCARPEYGILRPELSTPADFTGRCTALGIPVYQSLKQFCTDDRLATAKADVDWVLFENAPALEAYRASAREQVACGYPPIIQTFYRAVLVAVKTWEPRAQCVIVGCDFRIYAYLQDLEDRGKLPNYE